MNSNDNVSPGARAGAGWKSVTLHISRSFPPLFFQRGSKALKSDISKYPKTIRTADIGRKDSPFKGINVTSQNKGRSNTTAEHNIQAYL